MDVSRDGYQWWNAINFFNLFSLPIFIHRFVRSFSIETWSIMVNAWQELDVFQSKQKKLARIGGRIELIYWIEQSNWRLEVYPMRYSCWHQVVCLSTMASNSNVIKVDFEYTSTVVAKLVVKNSYFLRFPLMYPARCTVSKIWIQLLHC